MLQTPKSATSHNGILPNSALPRPKAQIQIARQELDKWLARQHACQQTTKGMQSLHAHFPSYCKLSLASLKSWGVGGTLTWDLAPSSGESAGADLADLGLGTSIRRIRSLPFCPSFLPGGYLCLWRRWLWRSSRSRACTILTCWYSQAWDNICTSADCF